MRSKDLKDFLIRSHNPFIKILKITTKIYLLPIVVIFPSNFCNFKCEMCDLILRHKNKEKKLMDFQLMKKILDEIPTINIPLLRPWIHFSGYGEPLTYPKWKESMEYCRRKKINWTVTTNGYLIQKYAMDMIQNQCKFINISIHGTEMLHNSITGIPDAYPIVKKGVEIIENEKRKHNSKYPIVAINCVITNKNILELNTISNNLLKLPINSITFQHLIFSLDDYNNRLPFIIRDKEKIKFLINFVKNNKDFKIKFYPRIECKNIKYYYSDINYNFHWNCLFPWITTRIYPNGDVIICNRNFGNIRNVSIKDIINNNEYRNFRKLVRKEMISPECIRCCHRDYY